MDSIFGFLQPLSKKMEHHQFEWKKHIISMATFHRLGMLIYQKVFYLVRKVKAFFWFGWKHLQIKHVSLWSCLCVKLWQCFSRSQWASLDCLFWKTTCFLGKTFERSPDWWCPPHQTPEPRWKRHLHADSTEGGLILMAHPESLAILHLVGCPMAACASWRSFNCHGAFHSMFNPMFRGVFLSVW